jgi:hypothetical protein
MHVSFSLIGCTILRAVSGILRTHCGRRGSGLGRHLGGANAPRRAGAAGLDAAFIAPSLASAAFYRPVWSRPSTVWAITTSACTASLSSPCDLPLRPCGSPLSHLAGVGQCPLANGHGCLVGLLVGVLDRRPVSPLPSTSACSGAGSGWHGCGWIADSAVYFAGLVPVAPARARACSAGPPPVWRIASVARLRRSRGYRTERGLIAGRHHCGCALGQTGGQPEPGPVGARSSLTNVRARSRVGLATVESPINRPVARSIPAGGVAAGHAAGYRSGDSDAAGPGAGPTRTWSAGLEAITDCAHLGHGSGLARAVLCPSDASRTAGLALAR